MGWGRRMASLTVNRRRPRFGALMLILGPFGELWKR